VLGVLVLVYIFNFLDRQIISILAERIKADLQVSDAEIGFSTARRLPSSSRYSASAGATRRRVGPAQAHRGRSRRVG
jgi:hypothetical protein